MREPRNFYEYQDTYETLVKEITDSSNGEVVTDWNKEEVCYEIIAENQHWTPKKNGNAIPQPVCSNLSGAYGFSLQDKSWMFWETSQKPFRLSVRISSTLDEELINLWRIGHLGVEACKKENMFPTFDLTKQARAWMEKELKGLNPVYWKNAEKETWVLEEKVVGASNALSLKIEIEAVKDDDHHFYLILKNERDTQKATLSVRTDEIAIASKEFFSQIKETYNLE